MDCARFCWGRQNLRGALSLRTGERKRESVAVTLAAFQNIDSTSKWLIVGASAVTIFYAVIRPFRKKKDPLTRQPFAQSLSSQRSLEREMSNLLVELSNMARQITAQLDTRATKLELLIKEADQKIALLSSVAPDRRPSENFDALVAAKVEEEPPPVDPRHVEVYTLADAGQSPREIAAQLNRPDGEVRLILALRGGA